VRTRATSGINNAILDYRVDLRCVCDVIERIRIENQQIGEIAAVDFAAIVY